MSAGLATMDRFISTIDLIYIFPVGLMHHFIQDTLKYVFLWLLTTTISSFFKQNTMGIVIKGVMGSLPSYKV